MKVFRIKAEMFASRVPILCRALKHVNGIVKSTTPQLQSVKHSGDWTYRTGITTHAKKVIFFQQFLGGCKYRFQLCYSLLCLQLDASNFQFVSCSYVVVDFLALMARFGSHYWWISVPAARTLDECRAGHPARWWRWLNSFETLQTE